MSLMSRHSSLLGLRPLREVRRKVSVVPSIYIPMRRLRKPETVAQETTHLLIEGFPRSGNTWTEAVIRHCATEELRLAHHSHAAAHVKYAVSRGIPVIVLYREPDAAVRSYLTLMNNRLDARDGFLDYLTFYRETLPFQSKGVLFFSFDDTTKRTADMINALKDTFGLPLSGDSLNTEEGRTAIFERMDQKAKRLNRAGGKSDSRPGTEDAEKIRQQELARTAVTADAVRSLRAQAQELFLTMESSLVKRG